MKTKGLFLAIGLLIACAMHAATIKGNRNIVTREISITDFDAISIGTNIRIENKGINFKKKKYHQFNYRQQTGNSKLSVTLDENLFAYLDIQSTDGKLRIESKNKERLVPTKCIIEGTSQELKKVQLSGSMDFIVESPLKCDELSVSVSGAGDIIMKQRADIRFASFKISGAGDIEISSLYCEEFKSKMSGAGDIEVQGKAKEAHFSVSGAGDVEAYDFEAENVYASVSGAGDIETFATKTLDASVSGIGTIRYKGNPEVKAKKSGIGSIKRK